VVPWISSIVAGVGSSGGVPPDDGVGVTVADREKSDAFALVSAKPVRLSDRASLVADGAGAAEVSNKFDVPQPTRSMIAGFVVMLPVPGESVAVAFDSASVPPPFAMLTDAAERSGVGSAAPVPPLEPPWIR
jgi:hypothetical protein